MAKVIPRFRFAYSSNAFTRMPLEQAIPQIGAAGFDGVEILADEPHVDPMKTAPKRIRGLNALLKRHRLSVSNVNANTNLALSRKDPEGFWPSLIDPDARQRRRRIRYIERSIALAARLGSPSVAIALGRAPKGADRETSVERLAGSLRVLLRTAARRRIGVGIEVEPGHFLEAYRDVLPVLCRLNHPRLGVNLDIGHAACAGEDVPEIIRLFKGRIWNLHFEDIRGGVHEHLVPGFGDIDFAGILRALREIRYRGFITLELYPYTSRPAWAGRRGLEHLRRAVAGL